MINNTTIVEDGVDTLSSVSPVIEMPTLIGNNDDALKQNKASFDKKSFYTLMKDFSKLELEEAKQSLSKELLTGRDPNELSSKGSTALHACAYMELWGLAQILLEAGANPTLKNNSGHSFFLTVVRNPKAPWKEILANFPELIAKHELFLEKNKGKPTKERKNKKNNTKANATTLIETDNVSTSSSTSSEKLSVLDIFTIKKAQFNEKGLDEDDPSFVKIIELLKCKDLGSLTEQLSEFVDFFSCYNLSNQVLQSCAELDKESFLSVLKINKINDLYDHSGNHLAHWLVSLRRDDLINMAYLNGLDFNVRNFDGVSPLVFAALSGWDDGVERLCNLGLTVSEPYKSGAIESLQQHLESKGLFNILDILVDHIDDSVKSSPVHLTNKKVSIKTSKSNSSSRKKNSGSPVRTNTAKLKGPNVKKRSGKSGKQKVNLPANFERSLKEASDFSYKEPEPLKKTTVVIVKKSRKIVVLSGRTSESNDGQ